MNSMDFDKKKFNTDLYGNLIPKETQDDEINRPKTQEQTIRRAGREPKSFVAAVVKQRQMKLF